MAFFYSIGLWACACGRCDSISVSMAIALCNHSIEGISLIMNLSSESKTLVDSVCTPPGIINNTNKIVVI